MAPADILAHGLRDAHPYPLVSEGKDPNTGAITSWRVSPSEAWGYPQVEYGRTANSLTGVLLDVDDHGALGRLDGAVTRGDLPPYNWRVKRYAGGGLHVFWALRQPVHTAGPGLRLAPIRYYRRVLDWYQEATGADPGFTGVLAHNPVGVDPDAFAVTWWAMPPYSLGDLAVGIPAGWRRPAMPLTGIGRNCDLLADCLRWAGREMHRALPVLAYAAGRNLEAFAAHPAGPLPDGETRSIAKSVEGYRSQWEQRGWHRPEWIERQRHRARLSGVSRRAATAERDAAIVLMREDGATQPTIAAAHGLSQQAISKVLRAYVGYTTEPTQLEPLRPLNRLPPSPFPAPPGAGAPGQRGRGRLPSGL